MAILVNNQVVRRSLRNKIFAIVGVLLLITVIIAVFSVYMANTLGMVTNISRAERTFSVNVLSAQGLAHKYLKQPDDELIVGFNKRLDIAHAYAKTFGDLPETLENTSEDQVVSMLETQYAEFDRHTSEVIVDRVLKLGWLTEVSDLIKIAHEGYLALEKYKKLSSRLFAAPPGPKQKKLAAEWYLASEAVLVYPTRFSKATAVLSRFVMSLATNAMFGLLLVLIFLGGTISYVFSRSIVIPFREQTNRLQKNAAVISATAAESAATVAEQVASVAQVATSVDQLANISANSATNAEDVLIDSSKSAQQGQLGLNRVARAVEIINAIAKVRGVVDKVSRIAEQSNLLAVNASIEAAKAGEVGRGFSVVASEVRALANQSADATNEIRDAISRTEEGRLIVNEVHQIIAELAGSLEKNAQNARHISEATMQQSAELEEISASMGQLSMGSEDTNQSVRQLETAADELTQIAQRLNQVITG